MADRGKQNDKMVSEIGRWITMVMMLFNICNQGPETRQVLYD